MIPFILAEVNWTNISANWMDFFTYAYTNILADWFWPMVIAGIVGYIYALSHSATAAAVVICLFFGVYGITGIFAASPEFSFLSWIIVIIAFSAAFVVLFTGRKR